MMSDKTPAQNYMESTTTLTGVRLVDIPRKLNEAYPAQAVGKLPNSSRNAGKATVKPEYVRERVNVVFGTHGIGWRWSFIQGLSKTTYKVVERPNKDAEYITWHIVTLRNFVFEYCVITADGDLKWMQCSPMSDVHENMEAKSAYRGALSSLIKQVVRSMGGFNALDAIGKPQDRPAEAPRQGLADHEVIELAAWAKGKGLTTDNILTALGIKKSREWNEGLAKAKTRIEVWANWNSAPEGAEERTGEQPNG